MQGHRYSIGGLQTIFRRKDRNLARPTVDLTLTNSHNYLYLSFHLLRRLPCWTIRVIWLMAPALFIVPLVRYPKAPARLSCYFRCVTSASLLLADSRRTLP